MTIQEVNEHQAYEFSKIRRDKVIFGTAQYRILEDGTIQHVPMEMGECGICEKELK